VEWAVYFGGRLAAAGHEVAMVARGPHVAALRQHGLRVRSVNGDFAERVPVDEDPSAFGCCEVVLFCVKSYDTGEAAARLRPVLPEDTAVMSLQNGIDNEERIAAIVGARHVVGGAAFIFSTIAEPGAYHFGERDGTCTPRVEGLLAACREAGIDADGHRDDRHRPGDRVRATGGHPDAVGLSWPRPSGPYPRCTAR
jgi:2-dehydropantoate 2-reductase